MKIIGIVFILLVVFLFIKKKKGSQEFIFKGIIIGGEYELIKNIYEDEIVFTKKTSISMEDLQIFEKDLKKIKLNKKPFSATSQGIITLFLDNHEKIVISTIYNREENTYYNLVYINHSQYYISENLKNLINDLSKRE